MVAKYAIERWRDTRVNKPEDDDPSILKLIE